jgi:hypothetical protein
MNVRLQYEFDFLAGIYYEDRLQMNSYSLSMNLLTKSTDAASTNIAMERLKFFLQTQMQSTVFINQNNMPKAEMLALLGANVTTLPEEPVDQIIGMMLYYKLNAIMEGRLEIVQLDVNSSLGDGVWYMHDEEDSAGPFNAKGWWHDASIQHETIEFEPADDNVVRVTSTGWYESGLDWPEDTPPPAKNTVVFAKFPKNEN